MFLISTTKWKTQDKRYFTQFQNGDYLCRDIRKINQQKKHSSEKN